jgi:hypothetical protein
MAACFGSAARIESRAYNRSAAAFVARKSKDCAAEHPDFASRHAPRAIMSNGRAFAAYAAGIFVDVVAEEEHEIELLARHVAVGGVVAVLEILAGGDGEAELVELRAVRGRRARAAAGAAQRSALPQKHNGGRSRGIGRRV